MSYTKGKFYTVDGVCTGCSIVVELAPTCIKFQENSNSKSGDAPCNVVKQPDSEDELNEIINAMKLSCVEAVRYSGDDAYVLKKLKDNNLNHLVD